MNEWTKKIILRIAGIFLIVLLCIWGISNSIQSDRTRKLYDQYRERVAETERINKELAGRIEQCQSICGELESSIERSISNTRDAIELISEIRVQVQYLENIVDSLNINEYYPANNGILSEK